MEYLINEKVFKTETENNVISECITPIKQGDISEYLIKIKFDGQIEPKPYRITFREKLVDEFGFFSSKSGGDKKITPNWLKREEESRTASGMPFFTLFSKGDKNRMTVALLDASTPSKLRVGVTEESGEIEVYVELFTSLCAKTSEYETVLLIDKRDVDFSSAVKDVRAWWGKNGLKNSYTPKFATKPMYSTWYSFHQDVIAENVLKECEVAKKLGMESVIVDDGWQTDNNARGYAYCGDWKVFDGKIPDMKKFVNSVHELNMKFLIWYSVPFVGVHSSVYKKFEGKYLSHNARRDTAVLDPRFKEVREYLVGVYCDAIKEFNLDGLKLDFIDSFKLTSESSTDFDAMDTVSLEDAVYKLLDEVYSKVTEINPEFMIEFRQSYVGPVIGKYGNIFRVSDCPYDSISNKIGAISLRLTSGTTAVHSDMIMWNKEDTVYSVAYQFLATMFAVPQVSVKFDEITSEQTKFLENHLRFFSNHEDTLMRGEFSTFGIDANFTVASAETEKEIITVLYQPQVVKVKEDKVNYIFNAYGKDDAYIESDKSLKYELYDVLGSLTKKGKIKKGVNKIALTNCGKVKIYK